MGVYVWQCYENIQIVLNYVDQHVEIIPHLAYHDQILFLSFPLIVL